MVGSPIYDSKGGSDQWAKGPQEVKNKTFTKEKSAG